jgi:hypothetical protein
MKIRSLLLGSVAAAGLSTAGFAADLGVVTSLDVCDELGVSGLTISSDDNCLVITGGVTYEYAFGSYEPGLNVITFDGAGIGSTTRIEDSVAPGLDGNSDVDAWLKFVASADSDFGLATATIKLISENGDGTADQTVGIDEAWVGIGDTTMIMAGYKASIFADGDDVPLNYLGLFLSDKVDKGVKASSVSAGTGGTVIQVVSNLGNGIDVGVGLENLGNEVAGQPVPSVVGVVKYAGDGIAAHASGAIDRAGQWKVHSGFTGTWDPITVVAAVAADGSGYWNALGSVKATFDIFTLAVSGEATSENEWGVGGSVSAAVVDGITLNLGSRYFQDTAGTTVTAWQTEGGISAKVTETVTLTAAAGYLSTTDVAGNVFYGKAGMAWAPGGGFDLSLNGEANSSGAYKGTFKASKSIK